MELTTENYYSLEANKHYMSVSQFKSFLRCEAASMGYLDYERSEVKSDALLFGSYVHSWLDGTMEQFKIDNPDMFSSKGATKGQLKATYRVANDMIESLKEDPFCMMALTGEKEVIMTGELFEVPWKIRMDVYNPAQNRFADLKTVQDIYKKHWIQDVGWGSFVEAFGYTTQMAVYSEIERQYRGGKEWLENYIVAVSKEGPPNKEVINVDQMSLEDELAMVEEKLPRIIKVKQGIEKPIACGKCQYCRKHKKVTSVTHYSELIK